MASDVLKLLLSSMKLERDRGVGELQKLLAASAGQVICDLQENFLRLSQESDTPWETKHGCLLGARCVIPYLTLEEERDDEFVQKMKMIALHHLTDAEVRVRLAAGELLGALCEKIGPVIYQECRDQILSLIRHNLERESGDDEASKLEQEETEMLMEKLAGPRQRLSSADAAQIFHDTAGWKSLETSMKCLQSIVDGCGIYFQPHVDQELLDIIFQTLTHSNRFVRETGYYVCASLVSCGNQERDSEGRDSLSDINPVFAYGNQFSKHMSIGMADNWSQVRLAASVATRKFLISLPGMEAREVFYPELLPRMCLNRYYMAEGVRIYSQETWRQVAGSEGKELVQKYIPHVVDYYIEATEADNHAVREAACACVAELAAKIQPESLRSYVPKLLQILMVCFQDDSWLVRDAACMACGNFILCFPEESQGAMDGLYPMFFGNLQDPIPSVRQGAASALGNVVRAHGKEALALVIERVKAGIEGLKNQPSESEKYGNLDTGLTTFGVAKRLRDNDMELHENRQMYSCGSLAPKMGRGSGGCSGHSYKKPSEPWELADGCIHLVAELSQIPEAVPQMPLLLSLVADACHHKHYTHHIILLETVCRQIPNIARNIGKKMFKPHIEEFFDPIFYSLDCENALTSSSASQCLNQLGTFLGPNILRARVRQYNPRYLQHLDANIFIAPL